MKEGRYTKLSLGKGCYGGQEEPFCNICLLPRKKSYEKCRRVPKGMIADIPDSGFHQDAMDIFGACGQLPVRQLW
jgi:hypothetical protein